MGIDTVQRAEELQGQTVVRRFTDELEPTSDFEHAIKDSPAQHNNGEENVHKARIATLQRKMTESRHGSDPPSEQNGRNHQGQSVWDELDHERRRLEETLDKFHTASEDLATQPKFRILGSSAKPRTTEYLKHDKKYEFSDITRVVANLEKEFRDKHSKAFKNFEKVCSMLNSHRSLLAILPSQSIYASVFCGSVSTLVKAASSHRDTSETLSRALADISDGTSICERLARTIGTEEIKWRLAGIYAKVFGFFRESMEWYLGSRVSRFRKSFDESVNQKIKDVQVEIRTKIENLHKVSTVEGIAVNRATLYGMSSLDEKISLLGVELSKIRDLVLETRQQPPLPAELRIDVGQNMMQTLMSHYNEARSHCQRNIIEKLSANELHAIVESSSSWYYGEQQLEALSSTRSLRSQDRQLRSLDKRLLRRSEVLKQIGPLKDHIIGSDGLGFLSDPSNRLADVEVVIALQQWVSDSESQELWISTPLEFQPDNSARAAALGPLTAAIEVGVPFIAHFCDKPRSSTKLDFSSDRYGLLDLCHSLILQLLQFNVSNDKAEIEEGQLSMLDGSEGSWGNALYLLHNLLQRTPSLAYCIIHNLNILEGLDGIAWSKDFVEMLLHHQTKSDGSFKVLFTTSGSSRVLVNLVSPRNHLDSMDAVRELERHGEILDLNMPDKADFNIDGD